MGTEFIFALEVPGLAEPLRLNGRVIWTTEPQNATKANPSGMGIEFQYVDDKERRATESIVERLLSKELGDELARGLLGREPHRG
jgi:type IV pilus assembly protein PilZ